MIIVTGGAGFIGSNLVKGLNNIGITDILIVDDLTDGTKCRNMNALSFADYCDKDVFIDQLSKLNGMKIEAIFHEGACADTMEHNGLKMMSMNYDYSKSLLHFALDHSIRFIYASSASVYGNGDNGFKEIRPNENPLNVYAFSKFLFDQYVRTMLPTAPMQIVGLRYFNVYGQQENHKGRMASTIYSFYRQLKSDGITRLFEGSDKYIRDFIYVDDVVDVNRYFFNNPEKREIFNCGTGKAEPFTTIAHSLIELEGKGKIEFVPFPDSLKGKYQAFTQADTSALRAIGYEQDFMTVRQGVERYHTYLTNNDGFLT